jgi:hypothetical protein
MSKLQELKTKLEAIPDKQRRKDLVGKLERYGTLAVAASETLVTCTETQRFAQQVFADEDFQKTTEQTRKAIGYATRLRAKLTNKIEAVETSEGQFSALSESAKLAHSSLKTRWSDLLTRRIEEFEKLVRVAKDANLPGNRALEQTLLRLRNYTNNPPQSNDAVQRIVNDLKSVVDSVQSLGLKGPAGQFLADAIAGKGHAKDLCNPEITELIDRYKLWASLSVRLG